MILAPAAALAIWALAVPLAGTTLAVRSGGSTRTIGPVSIVVVSLFAGLVAWALLTVLERSVTRARRTWTIIALVVLVLSLTGPLGAVGAAAALVMILMHLAVGSVLVLGLVRR